MNNAQRQTGEWKDTERRPFCDGVIAKTQLDQFPTFKDDGTCGGDIGRYSGSFDNVFYVKFSFVPTFVYVSSF